MNSLEQFKLHGKVAVITGGAGLLGIQHAEAIAEAGGTPVLWDINSDEAETNAQRIAKTFNVNCSSQDVDVTDINNVQNAFDDLINTTQKVEILINNAANNPKFESEENSSWGRLEKLSVEEWEKDISIGLTGAFICSKIIGNHMAHNGGGKILNIASDLGLIAPDQRIYRRMGVEESKQPVKPITYSVVKHGIIGLTKYLATYWADKNVRANAILPGGVYSNQTEDFVEKLTNLIPMGRMAKKEEYKAAVLFLISEASSYMTGSSLVIDGGRSSW